jgi:hypothetical protein
MIYDYEFIKPDLFDEDIAISFIGEQTLPQVQVLD